MNYLALLLFFFGMAAAAIAVFPSLILMSLSLLLAVLWGVNEFYFQSGRISSLLFVLGVSLLAFASLFAAIDILVISGIALTLVAWDISLFHGEVTPYLTGRDSKESKLTQQYKTLGKQRLIMVSLLSGIGLLIGGAARMVRIELPFILLLVILCVAIVSLTLILRLAGKIYPPPPDIPRYRRKGR